jgi:hypothetical protein
MSGVGSLVRKLIEAGASADVAAEMVAEAFAAGIASAPKVVDAAAEKRRARDRERQAEIRRNRQKSAESAESADAAPPTKTSLPPLLPSEEKGKDEPLVRPKARRDDTSTRLPADWTPSSEDFQFALDEGLAPREVHRQAARFRDYWHGKPGAAGRKLDWPGTWRNWIRNEADKGRAKGGTRNERVDRMAEGFADLYAGLDEQDRQAARNDEAGRVLALPVQRRA